MPETVNINGVMLAVQHNQTCEGRPTIVFLHDSLGCIALWRDFPAQLGAATQCNTLVYDRQGYGQSAPMGNKARDNQYMEQEANVLHALLAQLQLIEVILFGHSDGGSIALIAAALYPERIAAVITEGAHIYVEDVTLEGIRAARHAYQTTHLPARLAKYHGEKTDRMFSAWADTWLGAEFRSWNIEHFLPQITCPVLAIQGTEDEFGTAAQVHDIVRQVAGPATPQLIPGAAHTPHKEATEITLQYCVEFIGGIVG